MSIVMSVHGPAARSRWEHWPGTLYVPPMDGFVWIDVVDAGGDEIANLQQVFGLHELAIEDATKPAKLAKVDLYSDHVFVIAKAAELGESRIEYVEVSIFLSERRVITICRMENRFGCRLRDSVQRVAERPIKRADFIVYEVLDLIVDQYFPIVQMISDEVLLMEKRLLDDSLDREEIARIFELRRETVHFQHVLSRMSDVCNKLASLTIPCISNDARPYFRDVSDNLARMEAMTSGLIDVIRAALEASSLLEQQRQSEITRQLAAWAGILAIPTAIAGIYGMNFVYMPETQFKWGYFVILSFMAGICGLLYLRFRKLGWLHSERRRAKHKR